MKSKSSKRTKYVFKYIRKCKTCSKKVETYKHNKRYCSEKCKWKSNSNARIEFRKKIILKKGGRCELCGYEKNLAALCFHHKNPDHKEIQMNIGRMPTNNEFLKKIKKELKKCLLLCCNCHAEIHNKKMNGWKNQ